MVKDKYAMTSLPCILEPQGNEKAVRKSWARLIQKIGACPGESWGNRSPGLSDPAFRCKRSLDKQKQPPILPAIASNALSDQTSKAILDSNIQLKCAVFGGRFFK
jgi:hypothetical protein